MCDLDDFTDFDGSFWKPTRLPITKFGVDLSGQGIPFTLKGTIALDGSTRAVFTSPEGRIRLRRLGGPSYAYSRGCY
jgi:hypothetical protein